MSRFIIKANRFLNYTFHKLASKLSKTTHGNDFFYGISPKDMMKIATAEMLLRFQNTVSVPTICSVSVTNKCNYKCLKCGFHGQIHSKNNIADYPHSTIRNKDIFCHLLSLILAGDGEPTLDSSIETLISSSQKACPSTRKTLVTNGSRITQLSKDFLKNINVLSVSIDTVDTDKYRALTGTGILQNVVDGIQYAKKTNPNLYIKCGFVSASYNINELEDILLFCKNNKINELNIGPIQTNDKRLLPHISNRNKFVEFLNKHKKSRAPIVVARSAVDLYFQDSHLSTDTINTVENIKTFCDNLSEKQLQPFHKNTGWKKYYIDDTVTAHETIPTPHCNNWLEYYSELCSRLVKLCKIDLPYCLNPWYFIVFGLDTNTFAPCCVISSKFSTKYSEIEKNTFLSSDFESIHQYINSHYMMKFKSSMYNSGLLPEVCKECKSYQRYNLLNFVLSLCNELGIDKKRLHVSDHDVVPDGFRHIFQNQIQK